MLQSLRVLSSHEHSGFTWAMDERHAGWFAQCHRRCISLERPMPLTNSLPRAGPVEVKRSESSPTVLVPRGTGDDDLEVVAWGGPNGEWLEPTVTVRPRPNLEYFIRTMHPEGMRSMPLETGISLDGGIQGAARTAVMDLFLSAIPP